jgi:hypothetical protein
MTIKLTLETRHSLNESVTSVLTIYLLYTIIKWPFTAIASTDIELARKPSLTATDYDRKFP